MGSMENFVKRGRSAGERLWLDVAPSTSPNSVSGSTGSREHPKTPIRTTLTTLLRHHQMLEKKSKEEEEKVQGFVQGNSDFDYDTWRQTKEAEEHKEQQLHETKRILRAKLAYHKAIAASQQVANEKSQQARQLRDQTRKLRQVTEAEKRAELERRQMMAAEVQDDHNHLRQTVLDLKEEKRRQAHTLKEQTLRRQDEARRRDNEEMVYRKERIGQMLAWKQAQRTVNAGTLSGSKAASFIAAIGNPHAEIELKLSKERKLEELEERRNKVAEMKAEKERRVNEVKHRLERQFLAKHDHKKLQCKFDNLPEWRRPTGDLEDGEIAALVKELQRYQSTPSSKAFLRHKTK